MKKLTLALGGGGMKGFAHIGVISQLEKEGYKIEAIAGTSAGGIVGALYALGFTPGDMETFSKNLKYSELFSRNSGDPPSLLGLGGLYKQLDKVVGNSNFKDLAIPFAASAVDIKSGRELILNSGKLVDAIKATTAIPGIFPSVKIGACYLVDGGILDPIPVAVARWLNPDYPVIAVSLTPPMSEWPNIPKLDIPPYVPIPQFIVEQLNQLRLGKAMHVFIDSMEITTNTIAELRLKIEKPEAIIRPKVHHYTMFDKVNVDELIELGKSAVIQAKQEIEKAFSLQTKVVRWLKINHPPGVLLSDLVDHSAGADIRKNRQ